MSCVDVLLLVSEPLHVIHSTRPSTCTFLYLTMSSQLHGLYKALYRTLGPTQLPAQWVPSIFPGDKADGAWRYPPTPSSAEVKERVELYLYSPSGPYFNQKCRNFMSWSLVEC